MGQSLAGAGIGSQQAWLTLPLRQQSNTLPLLLAASAACRVPSALELVALFSPHSILPCAARASTRPLFTLHVCWSVADRLWFCCPSPLSACDFQAQLV
jgi:hypothetical protein